MRQNHSRQKADLLILPSNLVFKPLKKWALSLVEQIDALEGHYGENIGALSSIFNQVALLELLRGNSNEAEKICIEHVKWIAGNITSQIIPIQDVSHAFQPWINLGRIHSYQGRHVKASTHFNLISRYEKGESTDFLLFDEIINANGKTDGIIDNKTSMFLWASYIVDSLKNYLRNNAKDKAWLLLYDQKNNCPHDFGDLFYEAELLILEERGDYDLAIASINTNKGYYLGDIVSLYHQLYCYYRSCQFEAAIQISNTLHTFLSEDRLRMEIGLTHSLKILHMFGELLIFQNANEFAYDLCCLGYKLANELGDQRYSIAFSRSLANMIDLPNRDEWDELYWSHIEECSYESELTVHNIDVLSRKESMLAIDNLALLTRRNFFN